MPHLWIVLSLLSAFSLATSDALTKKIITPGNEYVIAWLRIVYSLPALIAAMALTPVPSLDKAFFLAFSKQHLVSQDASWQDEDVMPTRDDLGGSAFHEQDFVTGLAFLTVTHFLDA